MLSETAHVVRAVVSGVYRDADSFQQHDKATYTETRAAKFLKKFVKT